MKNILADYLSYLLRRLCVIDFFLKYILLLVKIGKGNYPKFSHCTLVEMLLFLFPKQFFQKLNS